MPGFIFKRLLFPFIICIAVNFSADSGYSDTTYIVQKDDNPAKIAKKFGANAEDIISINSLNPRKLVPGAKIIIPSSVKDTLNAKNHTRESDATQAHDNGSKSKKDLPDSITTHRVKKGETLSSLSKRYSVPVHALQEINNLTSTKLLAGQTLVVKQAQQRTYTVKKGDSLWKIAKRFHRTVDELSEMNKLGTEMLKPGQTILLHNQEEPGQSGNPEVYVPRKKLEESIDAVSDSDEYTLKEKLIILAKKFLDIPYKFGGNSFFGIDCSAFVQEVFRLIGINLPRSAREQFSHGEPVAKEDLSVGDLVFFRTYASFPSHVGIYLGNNEFIHTSAKLRRVTIDSLKTPYYLKRFIGAKRLIEETETEGKLQDES